MRLTSNKESVAKGEVSVLAIVETLVAIALVFYLSSHFNTIGWIAITMCVSPLLLMRTAESTRLGIDWFDRWEQKLDFFQIDFKEQISIFGVLISLPLYCIISVSVRAGATIVGAVRDPSEAIQAIVKNWGRITFAVDTLFPPELIPDHPKAHCEISIKEFLRRSFLTRLDMAPTLLLIFPALLYRWSFKATSIIYAPLIFVVHSTFSEGADLRTRLELIKRGDLSRIRAIYGVVVIVAFIVKLMLMMKWSGFAEVWKGNPITEFLSLYIAPAEIPKWQIAQLANSVLAVGAMLFARQALLRYKLNHPLPEKPVKRILGFVSGLRWVLALYSIVCVGYITMREAHDWHWPALGTKWLPFW